MTNQKVLLRDQAYNIAREAAQLWIPAFGTLYFTLAQVWGFLYGEEVVASCVALATFLGVVLKISRVQYNRSDARFQGDLVVYENNPEQGVTQLSIPASELVGRKEVTLKVNAVGGTTEGVG